MKNLVLIIVAIFIANGVSFGQNVEVQDLKASEFKALIKKEKIKVLKKGPYAKEVKFTDIEAEDLKKVYKVIEITKSDSMITDTTGTHPAATTQWFITFKHNGGLAGFWTPVDPLEDHDTKKELITFMKSGITQGDDEETNADSPLDSKLAPTGKQDMEVPDDF